MILSIINIIIIQEFVVIRIQELILLLGSDKPCVRFDAAAELKHVGPEACEAISALVERINDPVPTVQVQVIESLGMIGPAAEMAVGPLLALAESASVGLRRKVLASLKQISGTALVHMRDRCLGTNNRTVCFSLKITHEIKRRLIQVQSEDK